MTDITVELLAQHLASLKDGDEVNAFLRRARGQMAASDGAAALVEPPIRTLGDYLAAEIEIPPVLINPFLCVRGGLNVTIGRAGKGKTVMNLNRMLRWSAGLPWFDDWKNADGEHFYAPTEPLKILIVENEGAAGMFHRQVGIMSSADAYLPADKQKLAKENTLVWDEGGYSHLKLDDPAKLDGLRRGVEKWRPDIVFIEPFRSLWSGEENSSTEMNVVVDALVGLATDYNCGVWAAHHMKKGVSEGDAMDASRGSTVLEGIVTVMENFEAIKAGELRELTGSKSRYEQAPNPVRLSWDQEAKWYSHVPTSALEESIMSKIGDNMDEPMSAGDLADALDENRRKLTPVLAQLAKDKRLVKMPSASLGSGGTTGPRYRLPSDDNDQFGGLKL